MIEPNQGEVISIRGSVIDARFPKYLPEINNLLKTGEGVMAEVLIHLSPEEVRNCLYTDAGTITGLSHN